MSAKNGFNKSCLNCSKIFYVSKSKSHVNYCCYRCCWDGRKKSYSDTGNPFHGKKHTINSMLKKSGEKHPRWKGGKWKCGEGYIYILSKNHPRKNARGYVYQHILVMEKHLKRYLNREEVVHHINHIKDDNRIENLMLFPDNFAHLAYHKKENREIKIK